MQLSIIATQGQKIHSHDNYYKNMTTYMFSDYKCTLQYRTKHFMRIPTDRVCFIHTLHLIPATKRQRLRFCKMFCQNIKLLTTRSMHLDCKQKSIKYIREFTCIYGWLLSSHWHWAYNSKKSYFNSAMRLV